MGRFSTTIHIKDNAGRMRVINTFCEVMKKRGFVPCSEDEAALSYLLAFGEGGWVTLANEEYKDNPQKAYDDSREMAAALKTSAFSVEVVDSDFALLKLSDPNGGEDEVVVGDGSGYGIEEPTRGEQQYWEKLLADGKTWEQFYETAAKNEVFVEDVLAELARVLGIEPYYVCADHDEVSEKADSDNVAAFYFKKAAAKAKSMSLNAAFKKVFGEALEPLGYKLIKSKYPYFVRVVPGGEIIHVVSIMQKKYGIGGRKAFDIRCGVATVYRKKLDFNISPDDFLLQHISEIYSRSHPSDLNMEYRASIMTFKYGTPIPHILKNNTVEFTTDENEMLDSLKNALEATKQVFLPVVNEVTSLIDCEKYFYAFGKRSAPILDFEGEGLFLIKLFSSAEDFFQFKESEAVNEMRVEELVCNRVGGDFAQEFKDFEDKKEARKKYWIEVFNAPELRADGPAELEQRKKANTEKLRSYGLEI